MMRAIWVPKPIWLGFVPPIELEGWEPAENVWLSKLAKSAREALKPAVLLLARFAPITSIQA